MKRRQKCPCWTRISSTRCLALLSWRRVITSCNFHLRKAPCQTTAIWQGSEPYPWRGSSVKTLNFRRNTVNFLKTWLKTFWSCATNPAKTRRGVARRSCGSPCNLSGWPRNQKGKAHSQHNSNRAKYHKHSCTPLLYMEQTEKSSGMVSTCKNLPVTAEQEQKGCNCQNKGSVARQRQTQIIDWNWNEVIQRIHWCS